MTVKKEQKPSELRRQLRAPYRVRARLEIEGLTAPGRGWAVETCDVGESGVRIETRRSLPRVAVLIHLPAPGGAALSVKGWVIHSQQISIDLWEGGIEFETPQPLLSAAQVDLATFGR